jgi:molybdopterin converting factor small subunit
VARVVLTNELGNQFAGGETKLDVQAKDVRQLIRALEELYPGMGRELEAGMAVAIDGEIYADPFLEPIGPDSEVYFLPRIGGG